MMPEPRELAPRAVDDSWPATAPTPTPTSPTPTTDAPRIKDPVTPVPAGSSEPPIDTMVISTPTTTHSAPVTSQAAIEYAWIPSTRERSSSVRPASSSARPLRVTRKTAPIARASTTVIQPLVQTAPPMVLAAGESPVSALIPGVSDSAAKSSRDCWSGNTER